MITLQGTDMYKNLILVLMVFCSSCLAVQAQSITLATLDWPPYIGPAVRNNGYVTEIVNTAFAHSGDKTEIEYMPWARAVKETTEGRFDGLFPEYYSQERESTHVFSEPFPGGPVGFMKRLDRKISYSSLRDLSKYNIGVVRGYINTVAFDNADYLNKEVATSDTINLKKLIRNRVDLIVIDKFVARHILEREFGGDICVVEFMEPALESKNLYIAFSRKAPDYQSKIDAFNQGLRKIKKNGELDRILRKHNFL